MCGIAGIVDLTGRLQDGLERKLKVMGNLIRHRGPDGEGEWASPGQNAGFAHCRLSIIDLSDNAAQPMRADNGTVLVHNGEVYNYLELHEELGSGWNFKSTSDTEAILAAYDK